MDNNKNLIIDMYLEEQNCAVLHWESNKNLNEISELISHQMKNKNHLIDNLDFLEPILYIDCKSKNTKDIIFYIFQECIKNLSTKNNKDIIWEIIAQNSIIIEQLGERNEHITNLWDINWVFDYYNKLLEKHSNNKEEFLEKILDFESDILFQWLWSFLDDENITKVYLYLDNTKFLNIQEKQRINKLLFSRWTIEWNKKIYLKINDWEKNRNTRTTPSKQRIESPHDYSSKYISL